MLSQVICTEHPPKQKKTELYTQTCLFFTCFHTHNMLWPEHEKENKQVCVSSSVFLYLFIFGGGGGSTANQMWKHNTYLRYCIAKQVYCALHINLQQHPTLDLSSGHVLRQPWTSLRFKWKNSHKSALFWDFRVKKSSESSSRVSKWCEVQGEERFELKSRVGCLQINMQSTIVTTPPTFFTSYSGLVRTAPHNTHTRFLTIISARMYIHTHRSTAAASIKCMTQKNPKSEEKPLFWQPNNWSRSRFMTPSKVSCRHLLLL